MELSSIAISAMSIEEKLLRQNGKIKQLFKLLSVILFETEFHH